MPQVHERPSSPSPGDDPGASLREALANHALAQPSSDYHQASRSHIFYVPWLEPFGARGFGDFPDEAYGQLKEAVRLKLGRASLEDLRFWDECRTRSARQDERTAAATALEPGASRQIGLSSPSSFQEYLRSRAGRLGLSLNRLCDRTLDDGVPRLEAELTEQGPARLDALDASVSRIMEARFHGAPTKWCILVSRGTKARLQILAREFDRSVARLTLGVLMEATI
jgi:hypothetical protein